MLQSKRYDEGERPGADENRPSNRLNLPLPYCGPRPKPDPPAMPAICSHCRTLVLDDMQPHRCGEPVEEVVLVEEL